MPSGHHHHGTVSLSSNAGSVWSHAGTRWPGAGWSGMAARVVSPAVWPAEAPGVEVLLMRLDPEVPLPCYAHPGDAGADLVTTRDLVLPPGERAVVGTGIAIALPAGYAAFVHPRSGLAARSGLGVINAPGTIDAGYRGEVRVCLINHDPREPLVLSRMDRIAQLVVQRVEHAVFFEVGALPDTPRGTAGYGSTGTASPRAPARSATTDEGEG